MNSLSVSAHLYVGVTHEKCGALLRVDRRPDGLHSVNQDEGERKTNRRICLLIRRAVDRGMPSAGAVGTQETKLLLGRVCPNLSKGKERLTVLTKNND